MVKQALDGVKVLDITSGIAGPVASRELANHGAQVVHIQTGARRPGRRQTPPTATETTLMGIPADFYNTSKYSIALNLKHPRSRVVADRLIRWSDIILENFRPGTIGELGLNYEYVSSIKPDIIMVSSSGHGQTGPHGPQAGFDGCANAVSGRVYLAGWPDRGAVNPSDVPYADIVHPLFTAIAMVAALDYRRRTGKGQYIDIGMIETNAHSITPAFLDWQANARQWTRSGNRIPDAAPHGVFPCSGDDRWCAITIFTDEEWEALCHVVGEPPWTKQQRFATLSSRKENEDELEKLVAEWTVNHSAEEVMQMMQAAGVPAGIVQNAADLLDRDPQLRAREFLKSLKHPELGVFPHPTPSYKLLKTEAQVRTSPLLGEHTEYICTQLLGMTDKEFEELSQEGVFT